MGSPSVYLGDELSAAGYRLAGVDTRVPSPGEETACLEAALLQAKLVLIGTRCAQAMDPGTLESALALRSPLVMLVPDWNDARLALEPAHKVRCVLGLEP